MYQLAITVSLILVGAFAWSYVITKVLAKNTDVLKDYIKACLISTPIVLTGNIAWAAAYSTYEWESVTAFFIADSVVYYFVFILFSVWFLKEKYNGFKVVGVVFFLIGTYVAQVGL